MSMISGQIDRLHTAAQTERTLGHYELEQMLLDAADTIWQLRDDLQRANAAVQDAEHDESMAWDRVRKAEADADRLRELVRKVEHYEQAGCHECPYEDSCDAGTLYDDDDAVEAAYEDGRPFYEVENAKLRSMRDVWQENDAKLREQNSELRKLVADLWTHCPADRYYCALCEYGNDDGSECKLADRIREMVIEVCE